MAFVSYSYLTYRNVLDELSKLIVKTPPNGHDNEFRRILKEAQNLLINEATASPDAMTNIDFEEVPLRTAIAIPDQYDSIVEAWTPSGARYTIIDRLSFESNHWYRSEYPYHSITPVMVDMGLNENNQRTYQVLTGGAGEKDMESKQGTVSLTCRCSMRGITLNVFDNDGWTDTLRIYPGCLPALKAMMLSVVYNECGNTQMGIDAYDMAVKYLNDWLRKYRQGTYASPRIVQQGCPMQYAGMNIM